MKRKVMVFVFMLALLVLSVTACSESAEDLGRQKDIADKLALNQPTPEDIEYSLERYNLIKRAYWVNGQQDKARTISCPVDKPIGHVVLISRAGTVVGSFRVAGKVTSLNSYLTPDSTYYATSGLSSWVADVDGSYGENQEGIFFFTETDEYIEWSGDYLYSSMPFTFDESVLTVVK